MGDIVIIGGTKGIGRELAHHCARTGETVVIAGRSLETAERTASEINAQVGREAVRGIAVDLAAPHGLRAALASITAVRHLVIAAVARDQNSLADYRIDAAIDLATVKVVGYPAAVAELRPRFDDGASVLLFGGVSKDRPYPGSTTITSVNTAVTGLVHTMMHELRPHRCNAIHPGVVADSPFCINNERVLELGRKMTLAATLPRMEDIVQGCLFLMNNPAANGINLSLDGGRA